MGRAGPNLSTYHERRDFARTDEPFGRPARKGKGRAVQGQYVIQKHSARSLHYDFRLELDGVLLSWAVPKGPSEDPRVKRLARETEPHPLEYGSFEGTIPSGQYGAGAVMVWDRGSWEPEGDGRVGYAKGHLSFELHGDKLQGRWHLVRTKRGKDDKSWLLFKARDEAAHEREIVAAAPDSALTGRSLEQIAAGATLEAPAKPARSARGKQQRASASMPAFIEPELATLVNDAPEGDAWLHELKFDGYRVQAHVDREEVALLTRRGKDWSARMPTLARALSELNLRHTILDGEVITLDAKGISDFQRLQNSLVAERDADLLYYAFDLLYLDGEDLRDRPLHERKARLAHLLSAATGARHDGTLGAVRLSEHVRGDGPAFFAQACKLGLEGIVSKVAEAPYRSGRGHDWRKVKCGLRQEFVIVGYTQPRGERAHFGALLLGVERNGRLEYAGRVGTGFTAESLRELHGQLEARERDDAPVADPPRGAAARDVRWVNPQLVAEISFTGFTDDGLLRHPSFQGLREDKPAREVALERAAPSYPLTHPDKVLYPEQGVTKRELLFYYELVAERMLPHVQNRPLTLVRCPNGRGKPCFFQKHPGKGMPDGVRSVPIREKEGKAPYAVIDGARGLFGLVQMGALEIHTWGSHADDYEHPDLLVFDLDPDPDLPFEKVIRAAQRLRRIFESAKLESFVKTTGGKGLHVCIPIEPDLKWPNVKDFCAAVAEALTADAPHDYVATATKAKRKGKIFVDYLRNARGATFVAPYSSRARPGAPIACPLEWDELSPRFAPNQVTVRTIQQRLAKQRSDPFARMAGLRQRLR